MSRFFELLAVEIAGKSPHPDGVVKREMFEKKHAALGN